MAHLTSPLNTKKLLTNTEFIESILIESDHDVSSLSRSSSSSDEEFFVSSDAESSSSTDNDVANNRDLEILPSHPKKAPQILKTSLISTSLPITSAPPPTTTVNTLSSLTKLLLLNGTPMPSFTSPLNSNKSPLIRIQPKLTTGNDIYQVNKIPK